MSVDSLPGLNATLNTISFLLLIGGYVYVKRGRPDVHQRFMVAALTTSALFLISYVIYHYMAGSRPYPYHDWTRPVYFAVLIPHVILAALMAPFVILAVWHAFRQRIEKHRRIVRWLWPVWIFVSISGVVVYLMLYQL